MKKFALLLGLFLTFSTASRADICYHINETVVTKAVEILKNQKEIYVYCSLCSEAQPEVMQIQGIKSGSPIYVNDNALDLAHIYYKQNNKFINLGIAAGCIKDGEFEITAELEDLPVIRRSKIDNKKQAKIQTQKIFDACFTKTQKKSSFSTLDMIKQNAEINDCLSEAIILEIKKGFDVEQQTKMLEYFSQARKNVFELYAGIYAQNKYCYGRCGTMANLQPYSDEGKLLTDMLERFIYLNLEKNGY